MKPFLQSKTTNPSKITFVENEEFVNDDTKVAETLNFFSTQAALNLKTPKYKTSSFVMGENEINKYINRKHHPSVTAIK